MSVNKTGRIWQATAAPPQGVLRPAIKQLAFLATAGAAALGASAGLNTYAFSQLPPFATGTVEGQDAIIKYGLSAYEGRVLMEITRDTETVTGGDKAHYTQGLTKSIYLFGLPVRTDYKVLRDMTAGHIDNLNIRYHGMESEGMARINPAFNALAEYTATLAEIETARDGAGERLAVLRENALKGERFMRHHDITRLQAALAREDALSRADVPELLGIPEEKIPYDVVTHSKEVPNGTVRRYKGQDCGMKFSAVGYNGRPGMRHSCTPKYENETTYRLDVSEEKTLPRDLQDRLAAAQDLHAARAERIAGVIEEYDNARAARDAYDAEKSLHARHARFLQDNGGSLRAAWRKGHAIFAGTATRMAAQWQIQMDMKRK